MKRYAPFILVLLASAVTNTYAAQPTTPPAVAVTAAPPLLLTLLVLAAAGVCSLFCWQVYLLVKGGQLSRSWLLFAAGFLVLGLSQIIQLLAGFGVLTVPAFLLPIALLMMAGLFSMGLLEAKKVLG